MFPILVEARVSCSGEKVCLVLQIGKMHMHMKLTELPVLHFCFFLYVIDLGRCKH